MAYDQEKPDTIIVYDLNENRLYVENKPVIQATDIDEVHLIVEKERPPIWMEQAVKSTGGNILLPQINIGIILNKKGKEKFAQATANNIGKRCAVFINNELLMAPVIQEKIESGKVQVTTGYTESQGKKIVGRINAYIKKNSP